MREKKHHFNKNLVNEVIGLALRNKDMMATMVDHVREELLPDDDYRFIFNALRKHWLTYGKSMSIGMLFQKFEDDDDIFDLLEKIRDTEVDNTPDELSDQLEEYIRKSMFVTGYEKIGVAYNKGEKGKKEALKILQTLCEDLNNLSLKGNTYDRVMGGFTNRSLQARANRVLEDDLPEQKAYFGIDFLDHLSGGLSKKKGNLVVVMGSSGGGKTKCLRHLGAHNAKLGLNVLHVQLEGTRDETLIGYDATITGVPMSTIESGLLDLDLLESYDFYINKKVKGEIFVKAYEKFGESASTADVRKMILDIEKTSDKKIDVLVLDYLELLDTADRRDWAPKDERHKRMKIANELMDISKELHCVVFAATQAGLVDPEKLNEPTFVLTRYNVSEAKGIIKPATWLITINRTREELEDEMARLFIDKSRYTKAGFSFDICTKYGHERFYDKKRTMMSMTA
ncbi:MAG: DnaB-like helicase C-terminal domain-containing protein [Bacteroidota bacterium]